MRFHTELSFPQHSVRRGITDWERANRPLATKLFVLVGWFLRGWRRLIFHFIIVLVFLMALQRVKGWWSCRKPGIKLARKSPHMFPSSVVLMHLILTFSHFAVVVLDFPRALLDFLWRLCIRPILPVNSTCTTPDSSDVFTNPPYHLTSGCILISIHSQRRNIKEIY